MKTVITLLTFLIVMSIGSISYAKSIIISATDQMILDEDVTSVPDTVLVPIRVSVPRITTKEDEVDYKLYLDEDC